MPLDDTAPVAKLPRYRHRPGSRLAMKMIGRRKDRLAFLEQLARCGDPAVAADQAGLPLFEAFRYRDADPGFGAEWQAAVNYAWERVESRVLAALLGQLADGASAAGGTALARSPDRQQEITVPVHPAPVPSRLTGVN